VVFQRLSALLYRPESLLVLSFAGLIAVGTILLSLPVARRAPVGLLDACFTATSAVCVTGLVTKDTATDFSRTGQVIILVLIQVGGLSIMLFSAVGFLVLGRRMSFASHAAVQDMFFRGEIKGSLRAALLFILLMTLTLELLGALVLYAGLQVGEAKGGWFQAVFLAISAFCNAGFSVYSDNLVGLRDRPLVVGTIMTLIVCGGLGYSVLYEISRRSWNRLRRRRTTPVSWSLQSKVVLSVSAVLIVAGGAAMMLTGMTTGERTFGERALHALFQSVSARTAGFNTVDIGALPVPTLMILIPLMYIGGSPGGCAGGVKTTSVSVWLARVFARLQEREDVVIGARRIPSDVVRRAGLVLALAALWNATGILVLAISEGVGSAARLEHVIFEQISAFGTVGLSTGITPKLSAAGKLWIIATMFVGRVGPLTVALTVVVRKRRMQLVHPHERVMIG